MSDLRGHNSSAFGQELRADLENLLNEDSDKLFIYAQWHINDYIAGTQGMSLEHEGAYQRFLMRLYSRGKPLPDDDTFMANMMVLSTRVWRRIKEALIAMGKIIVRAGCLTNARFERERIKRAEQLRKRSLAAQTRWQMERENNAEKERDGERVWPKLPPNLAETSGKLQPNLQEKPNEIKETGDAHAYANQEPITNNKSFASARERTREELDSMRDKLFHAGGDALSCIGAGLLVLAEPIRWLDNGCDLEMDVLPAIRKCVHGKPKNFVQGWWFFTKAVQEARDRRLMPMEAPVARAGPPGKETWQERKDAEYEKSKKLTEALRRVSQQGKLP